MVGGRSTLVGHKKIDNPTPVFQPTYELGPHQPMSRDHGGGKSGERPRSTGEESWEKDQLAYRPELKSALGSKKRWTEMAGFSPTLCQREKAPTLSNSSFLSSSSSCTILLLVSLSCHPRPFTVLLGPPRCRPVRSGPTTAFSAPPLPLALPRRQACDPAWISMTRHSELKLPRCKPQSCLIHPRHEHRSCLARPHRECQRCLGYPVASGLDGDRGMDDFDLI
jgi:hypothetical protein